MFFTDRPIEDPKDLYDREEELKALIESIAKRSITLIIGLRRTGKTSLIKVATRDMPRIYIDARKFEERSYLTYRDFLREFRRGLSELMPKFRKIADYLRYVAGVNVVGVRIEFNWREGRPSLASILDCLNNWARDRGVKLVIVFDEAQEFVKLKGFNMIPIISYAYDNLSNISFIFAGSKIGMLYNFLKIDDPSSPLREIHGGDRAKAVN